MKELKRLLSLCLAACLFFLTGVSTVYAKSVITSVSLKVKANIEGGENLRDYSIDTSDDLSSGETGCSVTTSGSAYSISNAEWVSSSSISVGDTPRIRVYLAANDSSSRYFKGSYSSSNVKINGGSYVSAKKNSDDELVVTLKVNAVKGNYEAPEEAYWADNTLGRARWSAVDDASGAYDIYLYRGSSNVHKVEKYKGTSYNFYPYMTKKGTYSFKVRTVPYTTSEESGAKRSEWTESDEIYISEEDVSDGSGQNTSTSGNTGTVGWILSGSTWYYRYPDGSYQKDSWMLINEKWYLFDSSGAMQTGWQTKDGYTYFMDSSGAMQTGWIKSGNVWYYLNHNEGGPKGSLCKNVWIQYSNNAYFVDANGAMVEGWYQISGNWYYFYPGEGRKAVNTTVDGFYVDANGIWKK